MVAVITRMTQYHTMYGCCYNWVDTVSHDVWLLLSPGWHSITRCMVAVITGLTQHHSMYSFFYYQIPSCTISEDLIQFNSDQFKFHLNMLYILAYYQVYTRYHTVHCCWVVQHICHRLSLLDWRIITQCTVAGVGACKTAFIIKWNGYRQTAIAGASILVSCHVVKSLQLIWRSGTRGWNSRVPDRQVSRSALS